MQHNEAYRGDSPGKKISRLMFWQHVRKALGEKRFLAGPHLVLSSREAGDTSVLLGMGVCLENIVGVEWKAHEAAMARVKFPGFQVHVADLGAFALRTKTKFVCAFLDFCSMSNSDDFNRVVTVAKHCMVNDGLVGCAFMVGREKGMRDEAMRQRRDVALRIARMNSARRRDFEKLESFFSRAFLIQNELEKRSKASMRIDARFFYSSKNDDWHGHPWCGQLFWTNPSPRRRSKDPDCFFFDTDATDLRKQALELEKKNAPASLLLNITKTSMAAWKAHASRGTYG